MALTIRHGFGILQLDMVFQKRDSRRSRPTAWGQSAAKILRVARVDQTVIANDAGVTKQHLSNCLNGWREPFEETLQRINSAIARRAGHPPVEDYLNFEAAVFQEELGIEALAKGASRCLRWYGSFFQRDAIERTIESISALGDAKARKHFVSINRALRRLIVAELFPPTSPVGFTCVYDALATTGIDLEEIVSERCAAQLAWERFEWTVQRELIAQNPRAPANERLAAMRRIVKALGEHVLAVEVSTEENGLRKVTVPEFGKLVSHFYGDPRAAWKTFMPQTVVKITKFNTASAPTRKTRKD